MGFIIVVWRGLGGDLGGLVRFRQMCLNSLDKSDWMEILEEVALRRIML